MTKIEAGRLGWVASRENHILSKVNRIKKYLECPNKCNHCKDVLSYDKRRLKFCCQKCSALESNKIRKKKIVLCLVCQTECSKGSKGYCSPKCFRQHEQTLIIDKWKNGQNVGVKTIRRYLIKMNDGKCSKCQLNEWMGSKLVVELEHKDGNSYNNSIENVCLLCPNCHSQTPTYKYKNKGNGRHFRRVRYREGKSY